MKYEEKPVKNKDNYLEIILIKINKKCICNSDINTFI